MKRTIRRSRRLRAALGGVLGAGLLVSGVGVNEAEAVTFIKSDLEFMLQQIKISENHAAGNPLSGNGPFQIANPMLMYGVRTVDGTYNNLQPGQSHFGAADQVFPRATTALFRSAEDFSMFPGAPGQPIGTPTGYTQTKGYVQDSQPRVISNLVVDQSSNNPAAVAAAAAKEGSVPVDDGFPDNPDPFFIPNTATDAGLSAPYNSWFTFFGQFFDHGLDLVNKGKSGTVLVPLQSDDPLIKGKDGILVNAVSPGLIETDMLKRVTPEAIEKWKREHGYDKPLLYDASKSGAASWPNCAKTASRFRTISVAKTWPANCMRATANAPRKNSNLPVCA